MRVYVFKKRKGWTKVMVVPEGGSGRRPVSFERMTKLDVRNRVREVLREMGEPPAVAEAAP